MNRRVASAFVMVVACLFDPSASSGADRPANTVVTIRENACKQLQPEFNLVMAAHANDGVGKAISQRLASLDAAADAVIQDLQVHSNAFLNRNLATVGADAKSSPAKAVGSAKIVEKHFAVFTAPAAITGLSDAEQKAVDAYFNAATRAFANLSQKRGRAVAAAIGADPLEIAQLCFVVTSLATRDLPFGSAIEPLPDWMARPDSLRAITNLAVAAGNPRVAFAVSRARGAELTTAQSSLAESYGTFVRTSAESMFRTRNYKAGFVCLRDGIAVANEAKLDKLRAELRFQLAEALEATGSAKTAADEMSGVMADGVEFGRAAMLRLKYLYAAEQVSTALEEATRLQNDPRCAPYLPQILYIGWVAARRDGKTDEEPWRKSFLAKFPEHPLAADVYFASAMDLLAASKYDEASRLLEFIEFRFPTSKITGRVREIRQRLGTVAGSSTTRPAAQSTAKNTK